jgi:hypothetical protein
MIDGIPLGAAAKAGGSGTLPHDEASSASRGATGTIPEPPTAGATLGECAYDALGG